MGGDKPPPITCILFHVSFEDQTVRIPRNFFDLMANRHHCTDAGVHHPSILGTDGIDENMTVETCDFTVFFMYTIHRLVFIRNLPGDLFDVINCSVRIPDMVIKRNDHLHT